MIRDLALALPLAQDALAGVPIPLILSVIAALLLFALLGLVVRRYRRCPSNRLLVIYGKTRAGAAKCVHGGASFVWPLIQDSAWLPLDPFVVPIDLSNALSQENIRVSVPTTMTVAISTEPGVRENAAVRLLGMTTQEIRGKAEDIILGQMRAVIATMRIEEINSDRQAFLGKVNEAVTTELEKIGLAVINTNIKDIDDESGYIKALGRKAAAEAIQQAEIDVSEAKRRGEIGVAERERDRRTAVAKAHAEAEVGEAEADREKRVAVARANAQAEAGEALATREKRVAVASEVSTAEVGEGEAARTKRQKLSLLEAEAVQTESKAAADRAKFRSELKVTEEEARARAEAAARKADGDIKVADEIAEKRAEEARALREEARLKAEITVPAEVERQRVVIAAQAEREKAATVAKGEAEARLANAKAEAEGTQAVLDAKARGYQNLVEAVGGGHVVGGLLLVENIQSLARIQADAIAHLPIEKIVVWDGGGEGGGLARVGRQIGAVIPPLHELAKQVGLELPEFLGRLRDEGERPARDVEAEPAVVPAADGTLPLR